jgi:glycosyltransferase involved in cell wall biosynthesis
MSSVAHGTVESGDLQKRPGRICSIAYDFYPFDIRVRRLSEAAADAGFDVSVVCVRDRGEPRYEVCDGVRVYRVPMGRDFGCPLPIRLLLWLWFTILAGLAVTWLHIRHRFDVVIAHNMPDFLVFAALAPKLLGATIALDVEDVSPELMAAKAQGKRAKKILWRLAMWQERISIAFSDHIITVGWPFEQALARRGVKPETQTVVINSADPKLFPADRVQAATADDCADRPFTFMYYGNLAVRNGLDTALHALAIASKVEPRLRLNIMGRGEELSTLQALTRELGLGDRVRFFPTRPSEQIVDFVVAGDAGIIPYRCDGFAELVLPTKAYEMAWARRPIVASDTPAIRSMFRPESVILCDPDSPEEFARAMVEVCRNPELRARMVARAAEDYEPMRWDAVRVQYQELLGALATRTGAMPGGSHS